MERYILRFRGTDSTPSEDVARIRALKDVTVIDDSSPRMLLVEASSSELEALMSALPGWIMTPEQMIPLPDPRPKPRRSASQKQ